MAKINICALTPITSPGAIKENLSIAIKEVKDAEKNGAELIVLPNDCFLGDIGELKFRQDVSQSALECAKTLVEQINICVVFGISYLNSQIAIIGSGGKIVAASMLNGDINDFLEAKGKLGQEKTSSDFVYKGFLVKSISQEFLSICNDKFLADNSLIYKLQENSKEYNGIIIAIPASYPALMGGKERKLNECSSISYHNNCCVVVSCSGPGESVLDYVRSGDKIISAFGNIISYNNFDETSCFGVFDTDIKPTIPSMPDYTPRYLPKDSECREVLDILSRGVIGRMREAKAKKLIFGLSGGLDSAMTLLISLNCVKYGLDKKDILCVTLPSNVSSNRTKNNAARLIQALGVTEINIPISNAVELQLKDIDHDKKDVVYENIQARQRAMILFNLANKYGALVLGTGDLSESALGWCTYGGDALAHYNPNSSLTKTAIKKIIQVIINSPEFIEFNNAKEVLTDILNTPISPELLENQKTEEIIGQYILHEFFLLQFLAYKKSSKEIKNEAKVQFKDFDEEYINKTYEIFIKRFLSSRFKTNFSCDGIMLTPYDFTYKRLSSGISSDLFLE